MSKNIYALLDDKKRVSGIKTFYKKDEAEFKKLNEQGWGVFFAVNEFNIDLSTIPSGKTARNDEYCTKIRYAYGDLDIAKAGDNIARSEKEERKQKVIINLIEKCEPTVIIDTSNGIQPLWRIDAEATEENKKLYTVINRGIVEWSKQYGCKADSVFDTARILRLPGYFHQKEEPYLVKIIYQSEKKYNLEQLAKVFPYTEVAPKIIQRDLVQAHNPIFDAIAQIPFDELIIKAFASIGRPVHFDKSGHLIDPVGKTTGTFIGRKGDRRYLASSSHEPYEGNEITAVADILKIDYGDAYQWICKEYNLDYKNLIKNEIVKKQIKEIDKEEKTVDKNIRYTWGTYELDHSLALIKPGNLIIAAAKSGSGKTTYVFDMACKNALLGHKVLFLSLEMDEQEIKDDFGRKYSGITVGEEYDSAIPEHKKKAFDKKINEINSIENLIIKGVRRSSNVQFETLEQIIEETKDVKIVFIDNLGLIGGRDREDEFTRQKRIISSLLNFTARTKIPVVLIHHYRKSMKGSKDMGLDEMSGSSDIRNGADRIIKITKSQDLEAGYPEKYRTQIYLQKGRGYPEIMKDIYFIRGTFVDIPPTEEEYNNTETLNEIASSFGGELIPSF